MSSRDERIGIVLSGLLLVGLASSAGAAEDNKTSPPNTGNASAASPNEAQPTAEPANTESTTPAEQPTAGTESPATSSEEPSAQPPAQTEPQASEEQGQPQEGSAPSQETSAQGPAAQPAAAQDQSAGGATDDGLISVDFKDADIRQVLRVVSLKAGVDIVAGTDVEGLVTIKLTNVPWEQALDITLRTYGFAYERKGNIIRVMTLGSLEQEALTTEVFPLNYANAKDVPGVVQEMLSDRGKMKFDERTNTVVVTDIPASVFQIKQVIERLDQRTPQVLIEAKIVETKLAKDEKLGIDWTKSMTLTAAGTIVPTTFPFPGGHRLGKVGSIFVPRAGTFSPSSGATLTDGLIPNVGGTFTFGTLTPTSYAVTLNLLQSRTDTHIVTNPTITALNNQEAKLHIGEEYPIPNYSIDPSTGKTTITGYTPKNIGTVLTVTPHVNPSHEIVVDLKPEVITAAANVSYDTGQGSSVSLPRFTTQTAQTQVRILDAETIAIGGLVKETDTKVESKVPFLGDIPLIGLLFKNTSRYTSAGQSDPVRQDLLIFLTVRLTKEAQRPQEKTVAAVPSSSR